MSNTKIKAAQFSGVIGNGVNGYVLQSSGDGDMEWVSSITPPAITSLSYPGSATAADTAGGETITITGTGFVTGVTVTVGGTAAPAVSFVSATTLTITTPAKAAGDYDVVVTNTDTGSATFINGISYNGIPAWSTSAGSLGTFASAETISTITLAATEPDGGTITFNITNGALPTGLSLTGANIDGTTSLETAETLYTFTVTATDNESQTTPRVFTITVKKQFKNYDNFTINTYTGNGSTQSIEGKIGTAASFNGSSSYISGVPPLTNSNASFTISMWFKTSVSSADQYLFGEIRVGGTYDPLFQIWLDTSGFLTTEFRNNSSSTSGVTLTDSTNYCDGNWHHVVSILTATQMKMYIDGNEASSSPSSISGVSDVNNCFIGARNNRGSLNSPYNGKIDQVRIFNKALSSSEVTTLYGESNTSTNKSTTDIFSDSSGVALYEFEEGAKDTGGVSGYIGAGAAFNGSSSLISNTVGATPITSFSMWVKFNSTSQGSYLQVFDNNNYAIFLYNGKLNVQYATGSTNNGVAWTITNTTDWFHIAGTFTSSSSTLYIDNVEKTESMNNWVNAGSVPYIGNRNDLTGYFNGSIDQVRIFNKAISSSEVTTLYQETSASSTKSTTDIFDDSSGVALYELEGNSNDTGGITGRLSGTEAAVFTNADNSNFNLGNATVVNNSFGVSFWVKMNKISQSENVYLCSFMYGANTSLYMDTNNVLQVSNGGYSRNESFSTTHTFAADTWYHIVYTGQISGDGTLRCYVNGTQVGSRGWISGHNYTVTSGNRIGSYNNGDNSIDGNIADFRIYKSTHLSSSDVTALYSGTPPTTGLTEFYSFNGNDEDAQGNRVLTASNVTYNHNGTATNVTYAYNGTPTNVSFVGTSFQPDFVWIKSRSSNSHQLTDSVRGVTKNLFTNVTNAEATETNTIQSFDVNGFTVGSEARINTLGQNVVSWCWKAGGTAVSNTDGTITSTVSANQDAGFSIISYTGNSTSAQTIGHGLSAAPELIITKNLNDSEHWVVGNSSTGWTKGLYLSATTAAFTNNNIYGVDPTSTVYTVSGGGFDSSNTLVNTTNKNYIAYCFHSVDGYQKIGSYTGTGSAGNTVTGLGFQPRFLMIKNTNGYEWVIKDSLRGATNELYPNSSASENTIADPSNITFNSDGFTMNNPEGATNQNNATIIYLAIA
jgi:hypothetical protein